MTARQRYIRRRAERLRERGIRLVRVDGVYRKDAGEEENNNGSQGHGNTKLPFGLCQREGITIDPKWSPKDAWEALEGKGYSAKESYEELKKTGHVAKKAGAKASKKPPTKIEEKHFPEALVAKAYRKNTMEMVKLVNERCDDGTITEFLSSATLPNVKAPPKMSCQRDKSGEGCYVHTIMDSETRVPKEAIVRVPMLSTYKNQNEKEEAIRSFVHEWTHYIDLCARGGDAFSHFSEQFQPLKDAVEKFDVEDISDEANDIFRQFNELYDKEIADYRERKKNEPRLTAARKIYGENSEDWPSYVDKTDGRMDFWDNRRWADRERAHKYELAIRREEKAFAIECAKRRRALMDGVSSFQGLYSDLSGGILKSDKVVKYGHEMDYLQRNNGGNKIIESLANYVALKATNPKLADIFERNCPDIAKAMSEAMAEMTKKLRG